MNHEFRGKIPAPEYNQIDADAISGISRKVREKKALTREELSSLYEIERPLSLPSWMKDSQTDIYSERNSNEDIYSKNQLKKDLAVIFGCSEKDVAIKPEQVKKTTKVYAGEFFPNIFTTEIEHVFCVEEAWPFLSGSFYEKKMRPVPITLGNETKISYHKKLHNKNIDIIDDANMIFLSDEWAPVQEQQTIRCIVLKIEQLGDNSSPKRRALDCGLEPVPPDVGLAYRLQSESEERIIIGMKGIPYRAFKHGMMRDFSGTFLLNGHDGKLSLEECPASPGLGFSPHEKILFKLSENSKLK